MIFALVFWLVPVLLLTWIVVSLNDIRKDVRRMAEAAQRG